MAEPTVAQPEPDNNGCKMHEHYNLTCGTCNGYFDKDGNPVSPNTTIDDILNDIENYKYDKHNITLGFLELAIQSLINTAVEEAKIEENEYWIQRLGAPEIQNWHHQRISALQKERS